MLFTRANIKDKTNVFTLGDRGQIVSDPEPGIIIPQVAEDKNLVRLILLTSQKYPFEATFKSLCRLLMDNASSEYLFTTEFFVTNRSKKITDFPGSVFNEIYDNTIKLVQVQRSSICSSVGCFETVY